ncbi:unnamed protein product [Alopecurus aequalis]
MDQHQRQEASENYSNPKTCLFHVLFKAGALAFYILSALFVHNFVIIFVITVFLAALDFWVVKNVSGRILVGLRWWNEINDEGNSVWMFECLDEQSLARMNKKDSWLFWWTLYLTVITLLHGVYTLSGTIWCVSVYYGCQTGSTAFVRLLHGLFLGYSRSSDFKLTTFLSLECA